MPQLQRDRSPTAIATEAGSSHAAGFTRLYHDFFDPIYWYCRNRLGDGAAAEDAASAIFTRALAAGPRYDDPALRSWLFTIAHNDRSPFRPSPFPRKVPCPPKPR